MTNPNYTHVLDIVDRSGSMSRLASDMRGALDEFHKSQAEVDGKCLVDYVQFDTEYELVYEDRPIAYAESVLQPRGGTALLDAIGKGVTDLGNKLRKLNEADRPGQVFVAVVTDGYENASKEWTVDEVRKLIKEQEDKYNWVFVFLGTNIDAVAVGQSFGFDPARSMNYSNQGGEYVVAMAAATSGMLTSYRKGADRSVLGYTEEDRAAADES